MEPAAELFIVLAGVALGLTAGALLAEGAVLVPLWRSLAPEQFLAWFKQNGALLQHFFGPLEIVTAIIAILAAALSFVTGEDDSWMLLAAALLFLYVLAAFPLYFQRANKSFTSGTIAPDRIAPELDRWLAWHWSRTLAALAACTLAVIAA